MIRYFIRVNHGDADTTVNYEFTHKNYKDLSKEEQDEAFNKAVTELDRIYKTYGRFATQAGVLRLFDSFGFERSIK